MAKYRLHITSYEHAAGINIYTGKVQGGHAYAYVEAPDRTRVELERELTHEVAQSFTDLEFGSDAAYAWRGGERETTARLASSAQALELACAWMAENAPDDELVEEYSTKILYPVQTSV